MQTSNHSLERRIALADLAGQARGALERFPHAVVELALRAGVAAVFLRSGLTKIDNWDLTVSLFAEEYKVPLLPPEIAAYLATSAELICPLLLIVGLGARFAAAALLVMTAVIQIFVYPSSWPEHLMWASVFVYVLTRGAGALSVDHLIDRLFGRRRG